MKPTTAFMVGSLFAWPLESLVVWWVWNDILVGKFGLPTFEYWQVLVMLVAVSCLFPASIGFYLGRIADKLDGDKNDR
jgi:hypothetical protein